MANLANRLVRPPKLPVIPPQSVIELLDLAGPLPLSRVAVSSEDVALGQTLGPGNGRIMPAQELVDLGTNRLTCSKT